MRCMRRALSSLLCLLAVAFVAAAHASDVGVVLMHGKQGTPASSNIAPLASALQARGYLVSTPAMPWARDRIYDATFDEAMREIDREVEGLRSKGAKSIVIAGQSMGANAALGYAASREGISGIIALAPGHAPERTAAVQVLADDLERARQLIAAGKGKERARFTDTNQGKRFQVWATAEIYSSWMDPQGSAVMPRSAAAIKTPVPLLLVVGSQERNPQGKNVVFDVVPAHPKSKFASVRADHFSVPVEAVDEVLSWLASLRQ
jgi:esterase/lipase